MSLATMRTSWTASQVIEARGRSPSRGCFKANSDVTPCSCHGPSRGPMNQQRRAMELSQRIQDSVRVMDGH